METAAKGWVREDERKREFLGNGPGKVQGLWGRHLSQIKEHVGKMMLQGSQ